MNFEAMNMFLSQENIARHLEYYRNLRLKYSILEKSYPILSGKDIRDIASLSLNKSEKEHAYDLLWDIKAHECFFNSFDKNPKKCQEIRRYYPSYESFIYEIFTSANNTDGDFIFVILSKNEKPAMIIAEKGDRSFLKYTPILALDLCEHAYFSDYGFKKERYLRSALTYFDLQRLYSLDNPV